MFRIEGLLFRKVMWHHSWVIFVSSIIHEDTFRKKRLLGKNHQDISRPQTNVNHFPHFGTTLKITKYQKNNRTLCNIPNWTSIYENTLERQNRSSQFRQPAKQLVFLDLIILIWFWKCCKTDKINSMFLIFKKIHVTKWGRSELNLNLV